jgi:hypothetical protein
MQLNEAKVVLQECDKINQDLLSRWDDTNVVGFLDIIAQLFPLRELAANTIAGYWSPPVDPAGLAQMREAAARIAAKTGTKTASSTAT